MTWEGGGWGRDLRLWQQSFAYWTSDICLFLFALLVILGIILYTCAHVRFHCDSGTPVSATNLSKYWMHLSDNLYLTIPLPAQTLLLRQNYSMDKLIQIGWTWGCCIKSFYQGRKNGICCLCNRLAWDCPVVC